MVFCELFTVPLLSTTTGPLDTESGAFSDLLNENFVTTAAVAVVAGVAAVPAVVVPGLVVGGSLAYVGHKDHVGEHVLPFLYDDEEKAAKKRRAEKRRADKAAKALSQAPVLDVPAPAAA